jgi:hypothetical protein
MFYIYEKSTTYIVGKDGRPDHRAAYKTMSAAKAAVTRICKASGLMQTDENYPLYVLGIAEAAYFHKHVERQVKRTVLEGFGGKEYWEPINTPNYMSPSSETYWSM